MSKLEPLPSLDRLYSVNVDGSRHHIHPADLKGPFLTARRGLFAALVLLYVLMPSVKMGGHAAVQLDIEARRFYLFGGVFNAQDTWLLFFILAAAAFGLLFLTAWLGRVWCGWACPQTVFLEGMYRPIERLFEGTRVERMRLAQAPWSARKVAKKVGKHAGFVLVSLALSHVFLSLFVSGAAMMKMIRHSPLEHPEAFAWAMGIAGALYFNFAWFREQLCIVICPYGRLQSALTDRDSLIIGYDARRGEKRGKVGSGANGDCVDCKRCVVVCPNGIDIRDGLQMECIGCTQCIDACNEIMDKLGRPRGLIRYDSQNGLDGKPRTTWRGRLFAYGLLVSAAVAGGVLATSLRQPFEANLLRTRGAPYLLEGTTLRNQYELHLINKSPTPTTFLIAVTTPMPSTVILPERQLTLGPLESARVPVFVSLERSAYRAPFDVSVEVTPGPHPPRTARARFLGP